MDNILGLRGWQWLFLLEGIPSIIVGIFAWFLPSDPSTVTWLTPAEKAFATSRLIPYISSYNTKISLPEIYTVLRTPSVWLACIMYFCICGTPIYSVSYFLPSIIEQFIKSSDLITINSTDTNSLQPIILSNLLTIPIHFCAFIAVLANAFHSDRVHERFLHLLVPTFISLLAWGALAWSTEVSAPVGVKYVSVLVATAGCNMCVSVALAWCSEFEKGGTAIVIISAMVVGSGNIGGIVGPQIFGLSIGETGKYTWAAVAMVGSCFLGFVCIIGLWIMRTRNF
jgi:ACS family 4-hydroxyphenylacetate permease-like MFS transporter